jgi:hypothetical protein
MSTLLDERNLNLVVSPTGLRHIGGWFGNTLCGKWIDMRNTWRSHDLISVRHAGRMSKDPMVNYFCKRCASHYKDVDTNAD